MNRLFHHSLIGLLTLTLVACHESDNSSSSAAPGSASAGASPSLGQVTDAIANLYAADGTTLLGSAEIGPDGSVTIDVGGYSGPVVVEILGDSDAMYFDESLGTFTAFPAGRSLYAIAHTPSSVGVTILTDLAYRAAQAQNLFPLSAQTVTLLNERIRAALAPGLNDILSPPTLLDGSISTLGNSEADNYALYLAALAELGASATGTSPALAVLDTLARDLSDGAIDGQEDGTPIAGVPYGNFLTEMNTALSNAATAFSYTGNSGDLAPVSSTVDLEPEDTNNPPDGGNTGGSGDAVCSSTPASFNAGLADTYTLSYDEVVAGGPFTDGQEVTAVLTSTGDLQINNLTLTNPVYCVFSGSPNTAELIYVDSTNQIEYSVTNNDTAVFNEINVSDASQPRDFGDTQLPTFLGQLREADDGSASNAPQQILNIAGDYTPSVSSKSGDFASQFALNDTLNVSIDGTSGVITVNGVTFDPNDSSYNFSDRASITVSPRYEVQITDNGNVFKYLAFIENGSVVAHQLNQSNESTGNSQGFVEAEEQPLPAAVSSFFSTAQGLSQPVEVVLIDDDTTYNSGLEQSGECSRVSVSFGDGSAFRDADRTTPFDVDLVGEAGTTIKAAFYNRATSRLSQSASGDTLLFGDESFRVTLRADGQVDVESTFLGNPRDRLTSDPAEISSAGCDSAQEFSVNLSISGLNGSLGFELRDEGGTFVDDLIASVDGTHTFNQTLASETVFQVVALNNDTTFCSASPNNGRSVIANQDATIFVSCEAAAEPIGGMTRVQGVEDTFVDVEFANGMYQALGHKGAWYSMNGTDWTLADSSGPGSDILFDGNRWIIVPGAPPGTALGGTLFESTDGVNWTARSTNQCDAQCIGILQVAFNNGTYVGTTLSSADAISSTNLDDWSAVAVGTFSDIERIKNSGMTFVGLDTNNGALATSSDNGVTFTVVSGTNGDADLAQHSGVFYTKNASRNNEFLSSADGQTWSVAGTTPGNFRNLNTLHITDNFVLLGDPAGFFVGSSFANVGFPSGVNSSTPGRPLGVTAITSNGDNILFGTSSSLWFGTPELPE